MIFIYLEFEQVPAVIGSAFIKFSRIGGTVDRVIQVDIGWHKYLIMGFCPDADQVIRIGL
jgi:hypothetical protein